MKSTIRLGKIAEVEVSLHLSWFAVLALLSWWASQKLLPWLARTVWPDNFVDWSSATYWAMGVLAALLLLVSVVVHELAHSVVAQARGFQVRGITLFLFGGFSSLRAEIKTARDEFVISVVGPAASLVLAGLLAGVFWVVLQVTQHRATPLATLLVYGALVNLLLVGLNLLPAFPLDGGRVVRSVIWAATGSFSKATVLATLGGSGCWGRISCSRHFSDTSRVPDGGFLDGPRRMVRVRGGRPQPEKREGAGHHAPGSCQRCDGNGPGDRRAPAQPYSTYWSDISCMILGPLPCATMKESWASSPLWMRTKCPGNCEAE